MGRWQERYGAAGGSNRESACVELAGLTLGIVSALADRARELGDGAPPLLTPERIEALRPVYVLAWDELLPAHVQAPKPHLIMGATVAAQAAQCAVRARKRRQGEPSGGRVVWERPAPSSPAPPPVTMAAPEPDEPPPPEPPAKPAPEPAGSDDPNGTRVF